MKRIKGSASARRSRQCRGKRRRAATRVHSRVYGTEPAIEQSKADRTGLYNDRRTVESWSGS